MKKKEIKKILFIFLLSRIPLLVFLLLSKDLNIYDSIHYLNIAENTYTEDFLYAFFPLYPLLIRIFHLIIPSYYVSGMILSNVFSLMETFVLALILEKEKEKKKTAIIILFVFSPIMAFNSIVYTESLFLLVTLLSYYFYKKNNLAVCGLLVGLSMLTRNAGIILLGAYGLDLLIKCFKKEIPFKQILYFTLPAIIIGSQFSIYLYFKTKDPFFYATIQKPGWGKVSSNIITVFIKDIKFLLKCKNAFVDFIFLQNWLFLLIALFHGIKSIKKEFALSVYTIVSLFAFTMVCRDTSWNVLPSISLFRYVLGLFPFYLLSFKNIRKTKWHDIAFAVWIAISLANTYFIYQHYFMA